MPCLFPSKPGEILINFKFNLFYLNVSNNGEFFVVDCEIDIFDDLTSLFSKLFFGPNTFSGFGKNVETQKADNLGVSFL